MGRPQAPILDAYDGPDCNWWFVVRWLTRQFDAEELNPSGAFILSEPVGIAIDQHITGPGVANAHEEVRKSWRRLQKRWTYGWEKSDEKQLPDAEAYFEALAAETNAWIDQMFPAKGRGSDVARSRLLSAVRQQRARGRRKSFGGPPKTIHVTIPGALCKPLSSQAFLAGLSHQDFVRASLQLVLDSPELLARVKGPPPLGEA